MFVLNSYNHMYFLFKGRLLYITGGLISGGEGAYNRLLRYLSFIARVLKVMTDWVQALVE